MKSSPHLSRILSLRHRTEHWPAAILLACLPFGITALESHCQQPQPSQQPSQQPQPPQQAAPVPAASLGSERAISGEVTEDGLKQVLVGKQLFLRGGYLGDSLSFTEHGTPTGHPAIGSYTLSAVQIDKVRLTKHKVELEGSRYALHFLGALPYEDASIDRVKITPKKKVLKITIDREQVVKQKKEKESRKPASSPTSGQHASEPSGPVASSETDVASQPQAQPQAKPETAAAPEPQTQNQTPDQPADQAADQASVTYTYSPANAARTLREALDRIFAIGLDDKIRAQMPEFWQLYYQAQAAGVDYRPHDATVLRSNAVDQQAKVLTSIAPDSNEFAQSSGIAGRALYRVVIGTDGKPGEIAVIRPIGFGLDENAVEAIRKATFQPAIKAGQPVAESIDLAVLFRIYSQRTSVSASGDKSDDSGKPVLPGPYSVKQP